MADHWVCGKVCSEFWGMVIDAFGVGYWGIVADGVGVSVGVWVGDGDVDGIVFMCGDIVGCAYDNDWFRDTCGDGIVGVSWTTILPLPVKYRPQEDKVLPPLLVPLPEI